MPTPTTCDALERLIDFEAVHNFRDLGGYATRSGARVRWRAVFRADSLNRLAGPDIDLVRTLELATVIDLRTDQELEVRGRFPVEAVAVDFHQISVIDHTWQQATEPATDDSVEFLVWAYRSMLADGADRIGQALRLIAAPGALPAVFHCAAGKDRTGLVAAALLAALGVDDDDIVADYALTAPAVRRTLAWAERNNAELFERMSTVPKQFMAADPEAMAIILAELRTEHGSLDGFLDSIGVGEAVRADLRAALLED